MEPRMGCFLNARLQMLNPKRLQALEKWQKEKRITLAQVNGQRKYGGPPEEWDGPVPGSGCEVFVSHLPRETFEDRLIPLFSGVGPLWEFRLMMNFSGQTRGFAYAKYGTPALAAAAVSQLHGYKLEPGVHINVRHSTEKRQLCVGELPANTHQPGLLRVLVNLSPGVEGVSLKSGPNGVTAFVMYVSHHAASMAKKVLRDDFKKHYSLTVSVKWQDYHSGALELPPPLRCLRGPFNPTVGAPVTPRHHRHPPPPALPSPAALPLGSDKAAPLPLSLIRQQDRAEYGGGGGAQPVLKLVCVHVDLGRKAWFAYEARVPGLAYPLRGTVAALLSDDTAGLLDEVHRLVTAQVLAVVQALPH